MLLQSNMRGKSSSRLGAEATKSGKETSWSAARLLGANAKGIVVKLREQDFLARPSGPKKKLPKSMMSASVTYGKRLQQAIELWRPI